MGTLKQQSNGPLHSIIQWLVHWTLMGGYSEEGGTARRGQDGAAAHPGPSSLYQM